jgi:hypothetical protein
LKLISVASALLLAYLIWASRAWPLIHDAPLMHYIAWLIGQGAIPYRDAFDMNLPGVYLLHLAVLRVGGPGDLAWRLFDLGWLAAICGLLAAYCRHIGRGWAAAAGPLLFGLYHLSGGAWHAGQRDFLLCLFLLLGAWGIARGTEHRTSGALLWGGLALGAAMTLKPHDSRVGRASMLQAVDGYSFGRPLALLFFALIVLALLTPPPRQPAYKGLALVGVLYGLVHFLLQGKGWEYQLYPLIVFICALAPAAVVSWRAIGWPRVLDLFGARRPIALAVWALLVIVLGAKGVEALDAPWIAEKARRVGALSRDLGPLVPPGATVQVMDTTFGGIHALLRLSLRQPTRFIYDFHFFHDVNDPRIRALRAELVAGLAAHPPAAVVVLEESWPTLGYERLAMFPELTQMLERAFPLAVTGPGYRIYAKRNDS